MAQDRQNIVKALADLTQDDWMAWHAMRGQNPTLVSPYFHPDYVKLLGALTEDIRIICAYSGHKNIGFLAVQGGKFARPAGMPLSDYHGIIKPFGSSLNYSDILSGTGIGAYHFSSSVDTSSVESKYTLGRQMTSALEIETSAQAWRDTLDPSYKRHMKSTRRRIRKSEDEIGARHFVYKSQDQDVFDKLMEWKFEKFENTQKYNVLSVDWTMQFIQNLWGQSFGQDAAQPDLAPLRCEMHALYFGDALAAVDLGLAHDGVFHSWIVAYNSIFHNYAPGIQLLEGLIDAAKDLGYYRIDMGAGLDGYKRHYATHGHEVVTGYIPLDGMAGCISTLYGQTEQWGRKRLKDAPGKLRRRYSQINACEKTRSKQAKAMFEAIKSAQKT